MIECACGVVRDLSATSIVVTVHWTDHSFRLTSALTRFLPLAVVRASPARPAALVEMTIVVMLCFIGESGIT